MIWIHWLGIVRIYLHVSYDCACECLHGMNGLVLQMISIKLYLDVSMWLVCLCVMWFLPSLFIFKRNETIDKHRRTGTGSGTARKIVCDRERCGKCWCGTMHCQITTDVWRSNWIKDAHFPLLIFLFLLLRLFPCRLLIFSLWHSQPLRVFLTHPPLSPICLHKTQRNILVGFFPPSILPL